MAAAAIQFAEGGYTVVLDGHLFADGLEGLAAACRRRGVPLHYAVLRADLSSCLDRARSRGTGEAPFAVLHGRFADLGEHLVQERLDLQAELDAGDAGTDLAEIENDFVAVAAAYGERKGITYTAWRELGVLGPVLAEAGVTCTT